MWTILKRYKHVGNTKTWHYMGPRRSQKEIKSDGFTQRKINVDDT